MKYLFLILLIASNALAGDAAPMDLTRAPEKDEHTVLLLHFDEADGAAVKDESDANSKVKPEGKPQSIDGRFGKALQANANEDAIVVDNPKGKPSPVDFGENTDFTVELWVNTTSKSRLVYLIGKKQRLSFDEPGFGIWIDSGVTRACIADSINQVTITQRTVVNDGKWHHIALVVQRKGKAVLYVDGIPGAPTGFPPGQDRVDYLTDVSNAQRDLRLFSRHEAESDRLAIDEVRISNVARPMGAVPKPAPATAPAK